MRKFLFAFLVALLTIAQNVSAQPNFSYQVYIQDNGWLSRVGNNQATGTTGRGKRLEAIRINCNNIRYCAHVEKIGWQNWAGSGQIAGTMGKSLRMEAIRIQLTGDMARHYDIFYRVHIQNYGWTGWVANGDIAGTTGKALRIEAIQINLAHKRPSNNNHRHDHHKH